VPSAGNGGAAFDGSDLFAATNTNKVGRETEIWNSGLGDEISADTYIGNVSGKGGFLTTDASTINGKPEGGGSFHWGCSYWLLY